jgi:hypothetical protein
MLANLELRLLDESATPVVKALNNPFPVDAGKGRDVLRKARPILNPSPAERHGLLTRSSASYEVAWHLNQGIPLWGRPGEHTFVHQAARSQALVICTINEVSRVITGFKVINR